MSWSTSWALSWLILATSRESQAVPADGPPFELRWTAPADCPDTTAVRGAIERHLGRAIGSELGRGVRVTLDAARQDDGFWRTTIAFESPRGTTTRELADATECARAIDAAGLVIAIAIDPSLALGPGLVAEPDPTPPEPEPTPPPITNDPATEPIEGEPARGVAAPPPVADLSPRPRVRSRGAIGLVAGPTFGGLPRVGGIVRLHGALLRPRWRIELGGSFAGAPARTIDTASVTVLRWSVDARACAVLAPLAWLEVHPCGGVEVGQLIARPDGVDAPRDRNDPWLGFVAAARAVFVVRPRFGFHIGGDVVIPAFRRDYTLVGVGRVHQTAAVTGAVVAGAEVRFP